MASRNPRCGEVASAEPRDLGCIQGEGFGREGLRESLYPPGKFNMEPQKLEVWNMIFPFEFDDFWASKLIFRSVSGLFNKDFQKARNFQLLDGAGFQLHPAGP